MRWPEEADAVYRSMKDNTKATTEHMLDGMVYLVARHFKISMAEARAMSEDDFRISFVWATAAQRVEAEEMQKSTGDMKQSQRVGKTDAGQPFPGSERW